MDLEVRVISSGMDGSLGFSAMESSATGGFTDEGCRWMIGRRGWSRVDLCDGLY